MKQPQEKLDVFIERIKPLMLGIFHKESKIEEVKFISSAKLLFFLIELVNSGTFRGVVRIRIEDNKIWSPLIEESTELKRKYDFLD